MDADKLIGAGAIVLALCCLATIVLTLFFNPTRKPELAGRFIVGLAGVALLFVLFGAAWKATT
jgi:hypothetical protein